MRDTFDIRKELVKLNPGSHLESGKNEWILYVHDTKINLPKDDSCALLGDTIYDSEIEIKLCRLIREPII